jgi:hypothetical protein
MSDDTSVLIWCIVSALAWVLVGVAIARAHRDGLHVGTIFCLLFALTYPLKLIATGYGYAVLNSAALGAEWQLWALALSNLSAAMFVLPVAFGTKSVRLESDYREQLEPRSASSAMGWLLTAMVLLVASYGVDSISRVLSVEALIELKEQRGQARLFSASSALMRDAGTFCLITHLAIVIERWRRLGPALRIAYATGWCAVAYVLLAISGSKYMGLLPFAITLLVANSVHMNRHGRGIRVLATAFFALVAIVGIGLTGYLRGLGEIPTPDGLVVAALIQVGHAFDAPDNLSFILSRSDNWWTGDLVFAPTIQYVLLSAIPRAIWLDKPLILGNQYIMERYLPERFTDESGEVISPSMAGEMLLSGGIWFMTVWSFILGVAIALVCRWTQTHRRSRLAIAVYAWLCLNIFNLLRSGTGIVSPLMVFTAMSALTLVASRIAATVSRGACRPAPSLAVIGDRRAGEVS